MKITKSKLKQIIKEELVQLREVDMSNWRQEQVYDGTTTPKTTLVKYTNPRTRVVLSPIRDENWQWYVEEETYNPADPDERPDWEIRANSIDRGGHPFETVEDAIADAVEAGYKV